MPHRTAIYQRRAPCCKQNAPVRPCQALLESHSTGAHRSAGRLPQLTRARRMEHSKCLLSGRHRDIVPLLQERTGCCCGTCHTTPRNASVWTTTTRLGSAWRASCRCSPTATPPPWSGLRCESRPLPAVAALLLPANNAGPPVACACPNRKAWKHNGFGMIARVSVSLNWPPEARRNLWSVSDCAGVSAYSIDCGLFLCGPCLWGRARVPCVSPRLGYFLSFQRPPCVILRGCLARVCPGARMDGACLPQCSN